MKNSIYTVLLFLIFFMSCVTKKCIKSSYVETIDKVSILNSQEQVPKNAKILCDLRMGFNKLSNNYSSYYNLLDSLKQKAKAIGGNIIKLKKDYHLESSLLKGGEAHKIKASIYYKTNYQEKEINAENSYLNVYRYKGAMLYNFNLYLNDVLLFKVSSNFKKSVKLKEGNYYLTTNKTKDTIFFEAKKGNNYYLHCSYNNKKRVFSLLGTGPHLKLMNPKIGKIEFENFTSNKK